jgi:signal transduction histidine kinase/CHASE3 domain sensor protein
VGAGYAGAILLAWFVGFISTGALRSIANGAGRLEALHARDLIDVGELRVLAERMGGGFRRYLLTGDEDDLRAATEGHAAFAQVVAALRESGSPQEAPVLVDIARAEQRYQDAMTTLLEMREMGADRHVLARGYLAHATGRHADLTRAVDAYVVINQQHLSALGRESGRAAAHAERLVMTIAAVALILALAGGLLVALWITRAYRQALAAKEALRTRAREQAAVAALGQRALAVGDVDALIDGAPALLQEMLGVEVAIALEPVPGGDELLLRSGVGIEAGASRRQVRIGIACHEVINRALAEAKPVVVEDAGAAPGCFPDELCGDGVASALWVAVRGPSRTYGVLGAAHRTRHAFSHDGVVFAAALANVLGAAIERRCAEQALVASESRLAKAERGQRFLADAGDVLASSLDYETTLKRITAVAVPAFAEWCIVQLGDAELRHVVDSGADPRTKALADELSGRALREVQRFAGAARVLESGRSEHLVDIREALGEAGPLADALGMRSCMCLPIRGRGRVVIGVMTLIAGRSRPPYGPDDVALAEELTAKAALAIENARLYGEAQDAVRAREEFLMVASHELRTPLTSMKLQLHNLRRGEDRDACGSRADGDRLDIVARHVDRLADIMGVLFDASTIRTRGLRLDRARADLVPLVEHVVERLRQDAVRVGCTIRVHARAPAVGEWDRARVQQVVTSLLSNAMKYGKGQPIDVGITNQAASVRLTVRDRGMGIPGDSLDRVFGQFERAVPARAYGGCGLGLFIARHIVEAHGGSIRVVSDHGKGATFVVKLPVATSASRRGDARDASISGTLSTSAA